jgi:hypothetical protein
MITFLLHFDPPYWDLLEASDDPHAFDDDYIDCNYPTIACGEAIVVDKDGFEMIRAKYPQARFAQDK